MNKTEFVERLAEKTGLSRRDTLKAYDAWVELITNELASNRAVILTGFGKFEARARKESSRINPQTQKRITVPKKVVPAFKPGKNLKQIVDSTFKAGAVMQEIANIPGFHYNEPAVKRAASLIRKAKK